jgi:hypothetical protein
MIRRRAASAPDEFVHLKLKTDVQFVCENPFHDFARIDPAENCEKSTARQRREVRIAVLFARPFVIFREPMTNFTSSRA